MLYIGADHGGFALKKDITDFLDNKHIPFVDVGAKKLDPTDDYVDFAEKAASRVSKNAGKDKAILICRSGHGVCIDANKFKNVRAALCWDVSVAQASRNDDDANVLCLPADYISSGLAEQIVETWLSTPFSFEERHVRRLQKVKKFEG
jgi:ribose 5-phosphate isomerase B